MGTLRYILPACLAAVMALAAGCSSEPGQNPDAFGRSFRMQSSSFGSGPSVRPTTVYFKDGSESKARWANSQWYGSGPKPDKSFWREMGEFFGFVEDKPVGPKTTEFNNSGYHPVTPDIQPVSPE